MNLADALVPRSYKGGEAIINQGDAADGMYFIEDGEVTVMVVDSNGEEKQVKFSIWNWQNTCPLMFLQGKREL